MEIACAIFIASIIGIGLIFLMAITAYMIYKADKDYEENKNMDNF